MLRIGVSGIFERCRIEVTVMMIDELRNGSWCHFENGFVLEIVILKQRRSRNPAGS
jgi:hypothetical protein